MELKYSNLCSAIRDCLDELEYTYEIIKDENKKLIICCPILLGNENCNLIIELDGNLGTLTITNLPKSGVHLKELRNLFKLLNQINMKIKIGSFQFSSKNRELIYRISFVAKQIDKNSLKKNIDLACLFMDRYLPEIRGILA